MKALSIQQPWAGLIVIGYKDIENRDWSTTYRGPRLIHAATKMYEDSFLEATRIIRQCGLARIERPEQMPEFTRGAIVGIVDLVDVVDHSSSPWFAGVYGWILANPRPLNPIPFKGRLGLWEYPGELS